MLHSHLEMTNFAHRQVGDCLVAASGDGPLTADDFRTFMSALDRNGVTRYLSYSAGATSVSSPQRKQSAEVLKRRKIKVALVNESVVTLGLVSAARFMGLVDMRVFPKAELKSAVDYLGVSEPGTVLSAVSECCVELGAPPT